MSDFKSPTAVLVAISQKTNLPELKRWLVTTDVHDALYFEEAWTALWRLTETTETTAKEFAYYAKLAAVNALVEARPPTYPAEFPARLAALVCGFAQRTSFATFGDEYVAAALKMKLPAAETVWHPRKIPAYAVAAAVLGEATNSVVRPLIEQPIKEIILGTMAQHAHTVAVCVRRRVQGNGALPRTVHRLGHCLVQPGRTGHCHHPMRRRPKNKCGVGGESPSQHRRRVANLLRIRSRARRRAVGSECAPRRGYGVGARARVSDGPQALIASTVKMYFCKNDPISSCSSTGSAGNAVERSTRLLARSCTDSTAKHCSIEMTAPASPRHQVMRFW